MAHRTTVKIDPIDRDLNLILNEELSPLAQAQVLKDFATEVLAESQEINRAALGYLPKHRTFVDGAERGSLQDVTAKSVISFEFQLVFEVLEWIDAQLIANSPVLTTRYARSHVWFAEDVEMDVHKPIEADYYVALNAQPYARKIERGLSKQAPEGVYEAVAVYAGHRFNNVAHIRFGYRSFPAGAVGDWAQTESARFMAREIRGGNPRLYTEWLTRQPAIIVALYA